MPKAQHEDTRAFKVRDEKTFPGYAVKEIRRLLADGAPQFSKELVITLLAEHDALFAEQRAALDLLNQHLKGRTYTELDDALRNMLQAYISEQDNCETLTNDNALLAAKLQAVPDNGMVHDEIPALDMETSPIVPKE